MTTEREKREELARIEDAGYLLLMFAILEPEKTVQVVERLAARWLQIVGELERGSSDRNTDTGS